MLTRWKYKKNDLIRPEAGDTGLILVQCRGQYHWKSVNILFGFQSEVGGNEFSVNPDHCLIEAEWPIYASAQHANIASDNGLSPVRRQAIIWTNAGILSIRPRVTYFSGILIEIPQFHSTKCTWKCRLRKWRPSCLSLNMLIYYILVQHWCSDMDRTCCKICITNENSVLQMRIFHYDNVIMGAMASQITNLTIVYSTVYSGADQRKHQSSASLAFVWGIHWGPVNSPHKWPVTRKMFPFDDVIMQWI